MQLEIIADGEPLAGLQRFIDRLARPGNAERRKISDAIRQAYQANFSAEGSAEGPWRPLRPFTIAERRRKGFPGAHPILVQTGRMRDSFVRAGAPGHVDRFTAGLEGWSLEVGSASELARKHEFGDEGVPRRPITPLTDAGQRRISDVMDYVIAQIERQTLG